MDQAADMLQAASVPRLGITIIWVEHIMGVLMRVVDRVPGAGPWRDSSPRACPPTWCTKDPRVIEVYLGTDADAVQQQLARQVAEAAK